MKYFPDTLDNLLAAISKSRLLVFVRDCVLGFGQKCSSATQPATMLGGN